MSKTEKKLASMGLALPQVTTPPAACAPAVQSGPYIHTSGQLPFIDGKLLLAGRVGIDVSPDDAKNLAGVCALHALAAVKSVAGDVDRILRVIKVVGYVASAPGFTGQSAVINGASELLAEVFGDIGIHARSVVGVAVLPFNAPVEVEILVELASP